MIKLKGKPNLPVRGLKIHLLYVFSIFLLSKKIRYSINHSLKSLILKHHQTFDDDFTVESTHASVSKNNKVGLNQAI